MKLSLLDGALILFAYFTFMLLRYIYSGYIKSPRMINYYQSVGDTPKAEEWRLYMVKCRSEYVWQYLLMLIIALLLLGMYLLTRFFHQMASGQI